MKQLIATLVVVCFCSGTAWAGSPDSRNSLIEYSDYRDVAGEARIFWQYNFGHAKPKANGLRYGLRYDHERGFRTSSWRKPMLELAYNTNDSIVPFEFNLSGLNMLDRNYMMNADGGVNWVTVGTGIGLAALTGVALSSSDDGDDTPSRDTPSASAAGGASLDDILGAIDDLCAEFPDNPVCDLDLTGVVDLDGLQTIFDGAGLGLPTLTMNGGHSTSVLSNLHWFTPEHSW